MHRAFVVALILLLLACGARSEISNVEPVDASVDDVLVDASADVNEDSPVVTNDGALDAPPDVYVSPFPTTRIVSSAWATCAITSTGSVKCWGWNHLGEIGNGMTLDQSFNTPQQVTDNAVSLGAGDYEMCAVSVSGSVQCWGYGENGQLGNGSFVTSTTPVAVTGVTAAVAVPGGGLAACVLLRSGAVECMGNDDFASLALGSVTSKDYDTVQPSIVTSAAISLSSCEGFPFDPICALMNNASVECWGSMEYSLGDGTTGQASVPVTVAGIENATQVSVGPQNICIVLADGTLMCWGNNYYGQVGDGSNDDRNTPVATTLSNVAHVSVSENHTCAVTSAGAVECIGLNANGQLGNGLTSTGGEVKWQTAIKSGAVQVSCSASSSCALMTNGTVYCWGDNTYGQVGDGTFVERDKPVLVKGF